jgi:hypothetical protein
LKMPLQFGFQAAPIGINQLKQSDGGRLTGGRDWH